MKKILCAGCGVEFYPRAGRVIRRKEAEDGLMLSYHKKCDPVQAKEVVKETKPLRWSFIPL